MNLTPQQKAEAAAYQKEVDACTCLTPERKRYIQGCMDFAEEFPDGAFMAYMQERGIDVSELACFGTTHYAEHHAPKATDASPKRTL